MSDISFNTACKELKIAQIAQLKVAYYSFMRVQEVYTINVQI